MRRSTMSSNTTLLNEKKVQAADVADDTDVDICTASDGMNLKHKNYCYFRTVVIVLTFIMMGMTHAIKYTSIPDLRLLFKCTAEDLSMAIAIGTLGGVLGGPLGIFVDKFGSASDLVVASALFFAAVTFIIMPFSPYIWLFGCLEAICNMCWIWNQAASHGIISQIWGPKGGPARYAIHFGYPIGSMLGPLIAMPFMSEDSKRVLLNETSVVQLNTTDSKPVSNIFIAYAITSAIVLLIMMVFVFMFLCGPRKAYLYKNASKSEFGWREVLSPKTWADGNSCFGITIMLLMFTYYLFSVASVKGTQLYLTTFAVDSDLNFTSKEAATLNSLIYGIGTLGRGLATVAVKYVHITHLIVIETHGLLLLGILCLFVGTKYKLAMWILVPCLGFFREPIWPTGYVWTNNYIILFGVLVGINDVVFAIPNFFITRLQGYLYTSVAIDTIFYTTVGFGTLLCILVHIMNFIGRRHGDRKTRAIPNTPKESKTTSL